MAKHIAISPEALDVLRRGAFRASPHKPNGWAFDFPAGKLPRPLYEAVNKALVAAGGRWNRYAGAHLFERDPREQLGATLETGRAINRQQALQFFPTPPAIAERMASLAGLLPWGEGYSGEPFRILEPSAGTGRLLEPVKAIHCVVAVERDLELARGLAESFPAAAVVCADFLQWDPDGQLFDRILMNPPFERGADIRHHQPGARAAGAGRHLRGALRGWAEAAGGVRERAGQASRTPLAHALGDVAREELPGERHGYRVGNAGFRAAMRELKPLEPGTRVETICRRDRAEILESEPVKSGGWRYLCRWENEWRAPEWLYRAQFLLRDLPNPEHAP